MHGGQAMPVAHRPCATGGETARLAVGALTKKIVNDMEVHA